MMKVPMNISIDYNLKQKAKEKKINISQLLEEALELELNERVYKEAKESICNKCNKKIGYGDMEIIELTRNNFVTYHKKCIKEK